MANDIPLSAGPSNGGHGCMLVLQRVQNCDENNYTSAQIPQTSANREEEEENQFPNT